MQIGSRLPMPELAKFEIVFPYQFTWFCILAVSASYFLVIIVLKYLAVLPSSMAAHQLPICHV